MMGELCLPVLSSFTGLAQALTLIQQMLPDTY